MNNNCQIEQLASSEYNLWDTYVKAHPQGSFFHLSGWSKVIRKSFAHSCYYLVAKNAGAVCGVLPLVEVKSKLFGHALVSTPFCVYGGAIADSNEVVRQLESHACQLAEELDVDYLELRYKDKQEGSELLLKQAHSTFGCAIPEEEPEILANIRKKQRAVVRHSLKNGLSHAIKSGTGNLADFYQLLSTSYRNLGTPIFPLHFFNNLTEEVL